MSASSPKKVRACFVPIDDVVGPAFAVASPFDRTRRLRVPATFADVPSPTEPAPERGAIESAGVSCLG